MTALLLSAAGSAIGGAMGVPGGAMLGRLAGALAGNLIDQRLFGRHGTVNRVQEGPRLKDLDVQASTEGAHIPQVFGRARVSGEVIWATRFEEVATTEVQRSGGGGGKGGMMGGGGGGQAVTTTTTTYAYHANVAIGLCEGPIAAVGRVWADGKPLDLSGLVMRVHPGTETQAPDPLIQAKQGRPDVPAYRGLAYVVLERLPLAPFGNRLPQLSFEVIRPIGTLEPKVRGLCLIPGATEFGYHTTRVGRDAGFGQTAWENRGSTLAGTDLVASIDEALAVCPNLTHVNLVVVWFGTDLRCGVCTVAPGVDLRDKATSGDTWSVAGTGRADAHLVSRINDRAVYGGTPSDASVRAAIAHLKGRGLKVTLIPMVFLDVAPGNTLPDPWTGAGGQPAFPWRGRITCDPAPGRAGSPDGTAAVTAQVDAFMAQGYARMIRHYAGLAAEAGGVAGFAVGSELGWMTRLRSARRSFPMAERLAALAAEVAAVLPATDVVYAADWTEYGGYVPPGAPNDLVFPLDRVWAAAAIARVGIDFYPPLSDWRDGEGHADAGLGQSGSDPAYLARQVAGGEAFDWYYPGAAERAAQTRLPITDGAYGKPWVYRPKDLVGWWTNAHIERLDGVEVGPTAWTPGLKPIRLMELGVPAVDKGALAPNVFPDRLSSEGMLPPFSSGARDDGQQRRAIEAVIDHFDPARPGAAARNPTGLGGRRMIDPAEVALWCWDARPWPAFPGRLDLWSDGSNWWTGHWLNGRLGAAPVDALLDRLAKRYGGPPVDAARVPDVAAGYLVDRAMSGRAALEPLALAFGFDLVDRQGVLTAIPRGAAPRLTLAPEHLAVVEASDQPKRVRTEDGELPRAVSFVVSDPDRDYRRAAVTARRANATTRRESRSDLALVLPPAQAEVLADLVLRRAWAAREAVTFALPPSALAVEPGDVVSLTIDGRSQALRVVKVSDGLARVVEAEGDLIGWARPRGGVPVITPAAPVAAPGRPYAVVLDLPALPGDPSPWRPRLAVTADPWPGGVRLWAAVAGGFEPMALIERAATIGTLDDALPPGPVWRLQRGIAPRVRLARGALTSVSEEAVLDGANAVAIRHPGGAWEVVQFAGAQLIADRTYAIDGLLRGQLGTEALAADPVPTGALVVLLDGSLVPLPVPVDAVGRETHWRLAPATAVADGVEALPLTVTPAGTGLAPLAPVHARLRRTSEGVAITFTRRTRTGGDGWDLADVPLGEETEGYTLEVLAGAAVRRAVTLDAPAWLYPAALELSDFGTPQTRLALRLRQTSRLVGPGAALDGLFFIER